MEPEPESQERIFIPPDFYCPITGELLQNPVSDPSGHTYEKESILKWLSTKKESPITREYLESTMLTDNTALKRSIDSIRDKIQSDQLKIDSRLFEETLEPYMSKLDEITLEQYYTQGKLVVSVNTPEVEKRPPIDIVLCIDVSYSMFDEATLKGAKNERISHGISVLSLTISAAKTILYSLEDDDNISIVTYSSHAETIVSNQSCTSENKSLITQQLDSLKPIANTNMWSGIVASLDILKETSPPEKNKGIILLTDGVPNVEPPRGHETTLERYFRSENFRCPITTYGFGYNLDSNLLANISNISGGDGFSFIPDASILGSVFINGISSILTTATNYPKLRVSLSNGALFEDGSDFQEIEIDSLKYGRSKNYVFDIDTSEELTQNFSDVTLTLFNGKTFTTNQNTFNVAMVNRQLFRVGAINSIREASIMQSCSDSGVKDYINEFCKTMKDYHQSSKDVYIQNMIQDFYGQIKEALNITTRGAHENWYDRWGRHYLLSLMGAYTNEICNNFKDKGIWNFKSPMFNRLCDKVSTVFEAIPPPKPDIVKREPPPLRSRGGGVYFAEQSVSRSPLRSMSVYNNAGGGCCIGSSGVLMADRTICPIKDLKKGDLVFTCDPNNIDETVISPIECLVFTKSYNDEELLSTVSNKATSLSLTPYHPIVETKKFKWTFPISLNAPQIRKCEGVYTVVVQNRFPIIVQGFTYATLGHGITGEVIGHPFFGTGRVINDLKKFNTYSYGFVNLEKTNYKREGGIVTGIF
jgi:hypothetical protein